MNQQHPAYGYAPQAPAPKKKRTGLKAALGVTGGLLGLMVLASALSGGSEDAGSDTGTPTPAATVPGVAKPKPEPTHKTTYATFKVWGTAPGNSLGPVSVSYGSENDSRKGQIKDGKFEATLPIKKGEGYYSLFAMLGDSGDIQCSVTIDGVTDKGHAAGAYSSCDASLFRDSFGGGWSAL